MAASRWAEGDKEAWSTNHSGGGFAGGLAGSLTVEAAR